MNDRETTRVSDMQHAIIDLSRRVAELEKKLATIGPLFADVLEILIDTDNKKC
jgi:GTP1/Obg family GTP-binding protein